MLHSRSELLLNATSCEAAGLVATRRNAWVATNPVSGHVLAKVLYHRLDTVTFRAATHPPTPPIAVCGEAIRRCARAFGQPSFSVDDR